MTLGGLAVAATACGSGSNALGNSACTHVQRSITLYGPSLKATGSSATNLATQANVELRDASRPASLAAAHDGEWQALAATLSESSRVAEANLINALRDECAASPAGARS